MTVLLITEKYKTAQPFARLLGATVRHTENKKGTIGYLETPDGYKTPAGVELPAGVPRDEKVIVSWCAGHLCEMDYPDAYDEKYKRWKLEDLPILPETFRYHAMRSDPARSQFKVIKELLHRKDVAYILNAPDADREGEAILTLTYRVAGADRKKTYKRLWYTNTTDAALKKALAEAKPLADYKPLAAAADCRQKLDWCYGMNLSRAYTCYSHAVSNVGRVVSPTIQLIVARDDEINAFVPEDYATITVPMSKDGEEFSAEAKFKDIAYAEALAKRVKGLQATITDVQKATESESRRLFNTTQLQAEASKRFGYEPDKTMSVMQRLYDGGWMSYPRTKSQSINPEQVAETEPLLSQAYQTVFRSPSQCSPDDFDVSRIVDKKGKGAEDASHTGLVPTDKGIADYHSKIKQDEQMRNIFLLVAARMLCAVLPPRVVDKTKVLALVDGKDEFSATGSVEVSGGFLPFEKYVLSALKEKKPRKGKEAQVLPPVAVGEAWTCGAGKFARKQTKPPKPYTTAGLLSVMENVSQLIDDKKLKAAVKDAGLGTAASRDTVIKTIKANGFAETRGGYLYPTDKARSLMAILPDEIKSPVMTARMELALDEIARGEGDPVSFMSDVEEKVTAQVEAVKAMEPVPDTARYANNKVFLKGACPKCGADVVETDKSVVCKDNCGFVLWRTVAKKKLAKGELKSLVEDGKSTEKLDGFKSKKGSTFSCWLYLDDEAKVAFDFDDDGRKAESNYITKNLGKSGR